MDKEVFDRKPAPSTTNNIVLYGGIIVLSMSASLTFKCAKCDQNMEYRVRVKISWRVAKCMKFCTNNAQRYIP
jgi:hypothetical protein